MNNDYRDEDPWVDPHSLAIANRQHDDRLRAEGINIEGRIKASWNSPKLSLKGPLTDKKIKAYQKAGYYAADYKDARRKLMQRKSARIKMNRTFDTFPDGRKGNFIERDGRLIYSP